MPRFVLNWTTNNREIQGNSVPPPPPPAYTLPKNPMLNRHKAFGNYIFLLCYCVFCILIPNNGLEIFSDYKWYSDTALVGGGGGGGGNLHMS